MATRPTLPYFAPLDRLPAPLPTVADILSSTQKFRSSKDYAVVRVGQHFVVKYGPTIRAQEGENMLFVQQSTNISVPTVYAIFHDETTGLNFIVQEYIPGRNLEQCWSSFDHQDKAAVSAQLRQYFDELRSLPPPGYFGSVWRQPIIEFHLTGAMDPNSPTSVGPFDTEEEWVEAMLHTGQTNYPLPPIRFDMRRAMFHSLFRDHKPVFTHGDLNRGNIRIRDDKTVVLIDWEQSGWYPSYWEYCMLVAAEANDDDWVLWISRSLDEYIAELGWIFLFRSWVLWGG